MHALFFEPLAIRGVDLVAMAVAFRNLRVAVDLRDTRAFARARGISAEPHRAAEIALLHALLELIAAHPFGHQPDDRLVARAELGRSRAFDSGKRARRLDYRHLHAEADAEIRHPALAREPRRQDFALCAALPEPTWHEDTVDV